jgi:quercetin dioxygenase-like cupin family protein
MTGLAALPFGGLAAAQPGASSLLAYFTRSGNTRVIAAVIARARHGQLFEIRPARPSPADYFETVEQARKERDGGEQPPLASTLADIAAYRPVFLGFPVWGLWRASSWRHTGNSHDSAGTILFTIRSGQRRERKRKSIMKHVLSSTLLAATGLASDPAVAQPAAQTITPANAASVMSGPAEYFTGSVRVQMLSPVNENINASSAYVTFEPGARSAWHTHPRGQYLIVTAGAGLTQEWGKPVQHLHEGDVVWCPPGVKHWHGAAPGSALTHIAMTGALDGKSVQWMEKVSDEQYQPR